MNYSCPYCSSVFITSQACNAHKGVCKKNLHYIKKLRDSEPDDIYKALQWITKKIENDKQRIISLNDEIETLKKRREQMIETIRRLLE